MKRKMLLTLWIAAGALLLCACQQASAIAQQLDGYVELIESEVGPIPTVTPSPSNTPKPTYIPKITASPSPTAKPSPSLFPMPTPTAVPSPSPSATPELTPTPTATAVPIPTIEAAPLPSYAPIPQSVPFVISTPTPETPPETVPTQTEQTPAAPAPAVPITPSSTYATGQEIAEFALQYVGYNYLYGGESPDEGFDCSGFVYYVYQQFGYGMNRTADAQAVNGAHVEHGSIEPGDVLCFYTSGSYIGHSGIYIGGGEYVHAKGAAWGVVISPLSERGENYEARRIL